MWWLVYGVRMSFIVLCLVPQLYSQRGEKCQADLSTLLGIALLLWSNALEQNTEQKFWLGFPHETQEGFSAFRSRAADKPGCETLSSAPSWAVPRCHLLFAFQGLLPHPALCQSSVPSPCCSQSPLQLEVFWFRLFLLFFNLSEQPR